MHGIDLSVNAIMQAIERAAAAAQSAVSSSQAACNGHTGSSPIGAASSVQEQRPGATSPSKQQQAPHDLTFEVADVLTRDFPGGSFDVCLSRDSLLHVQDKQQLFAR